MNDISKLCEFCNKNIDMEEHEQHIRAEVIDDIYKK